MTLEQKARQIALDWLPQIMDKEERRVAVDTHINEMNNVDFLALISYALSRVEIHFS